MELGFKGPKGQERRRLATVIEAVLSSTEVLVLMPLSSGNMVKLPLDKSFEARIYGETSVFVYDVTVLDHPVIDGVYLTKLRLDSMGERIQLRDFYRVNSSLEFNFSVAGEQSEDGETIPMHQALTKDLSGGGMSFVSNKELPSGTEIYANFVLDGEYIVVLGKAMGRQETVDNMAYKYQYRCQFLAMPDSEQEKIVQFINSQQFKAISQTRDAGASRPTDKR